MIVVIVRSTRVRTTWGRAASQTARRQGMRGLDSAAASLLFKTPAPHLACRSTPGSCWLPSSAACGVDSRSSSGRLGRPFYGERVARRRRCCWGISSRKIGVLHMCFIPLTSVSTNYQIFVLFYSRTLPK